MVQRIISALLVFTFTATSMGTVPDRHCEPKAKQSLSEIASPACGEVAMTKLAPKSRFKSAAQIEEIAKALLVKDTTWADFNEIKMAIGALMDTDYDEGELGERGRRLRDELTRHGIEPFNPAQLHPAASAFIKAKGDGMIGIMPLIDERDKEAMRRFLEYLVRNYLTPEAMLADIEVYLKVVRVTGNNSPLTLQAAQQALKQACTEIGDGRVAELAPRMNSIFSFLTEGLGRELRFGKSSATAQTRFLSNMSRVIYFIMHDAAAQNSNLPVEGGGAGLTIGSDNEPSEAEINDGLTAIKKLDPSYPELAGRFTKKVISRIEKGNFVWYASLVKSHLKRRPERPESWHHNRPRFMAEMIVLRAIGNELIVANDVSRVAKLLKPKKIEADIADQEELFAMVIGRQTPELDAIRRDIGGVLGRIKELETKLLSDMERADSGKQTLYHQEAQALANSFGPTSDPTAAYYNALRQLKARDHEEIKELKQKAGDMAGKLRDSEPVAPLVIPKRRSGGFTLYKLPLVLAVVAAMALLVNSYCALGMIAVPILLGNLDTAIRDDKPADIVHAVWQLVVKARKKETASQAMVAVPILVNLIRGKRSTLGVRRYAIYAIGQMGEKSVINDPALVPALTEALLTDEAHEVREAAAEALGKIGMYEGDKALAIGALVIASSHENEKYWKVRSKAVGALRKKGSSSELAKSALEKAFRRDERVIVRRRAGMAIVSFEASRVAAMSP